jgi:hypothetical protein
MEGSSEARRCSFLCRSDVAADRAGGRLVPVLSGGGAGTWVGAFARGAARGTLHGWAAALFSWKLGDVRRGRVLVDAPYGGGDAAGMPIRERGAP